MTDLVGIMVTGSADPFEMLIVAVVISIASLILGFKVQSKLFFVYPFDIISLSIYCWMAIDSCFVIVDFWKGWYVAALAGYIVGYAMAAKSNAVMINTYHTTDDGTKVDDAWFEVMYVNKLGEHCQQEQTNRALLKRILLNIHHTISSDSPMDGDWVENRKYPWMPRLRNKQKIFIERVKPMELDPRRLWKFSFHVRHTDYTVSYGSQTSSADLVRDRKILDDLSSHIRDLEREVFALHSSETERMMRQSIAAMDRILGKSRVAAIRDSVGKDTAVTPAVKTEEVKDEE